MLKQPRRNEESGATVTLCFMVQSNLVQILKIAVEIADLNCTCLKTSFSGIQTVRIVLRWFVLRTSCKTSMGATGANFCRNLDREEALESPNLVF